ncbi:hypothetical protein TcasGA2_TC012742 [Tribolium castaneum]|uniref:Uncharacterized protein n=1 Tax=Tribolium castaneum TaxID=7070 RepID=D6WZY1_TRICA|nr:hypothetical protein TcasGA2_TC012742 [Tribolium castaneum]
MASCHFAGPDWALTLPLPTQIQIYHHSGNLAPARIFPGSHFGDIRALCPDHTAVDRLIVSESEWINYWALEILRQMPGRTPRVVMTALWLDYNYGAD